MHTMKNISKLTVLSIVILGWSLDMTGQDGLDQISEIAEFTEKVEKSVTAEYAVPFTQEEKMYSVHTEMAKKQIYRFISRKMYYPDAQLVKGIEGNVVFNVTIGDQGSIVQAEIVESLSEPFDRAVLEAVRKMKRIKIDEDRYLGARLITVPVHFSPQ